MLCHAMARVRVICKVLGAPVVSASTPPLPGRCSRHACLLDASSCRDHRAHMCVASMLACVCEHQCWVALQHFQVRHPEIRPEYSELLHMIRPDDPTLVSMSERMAESCRLYHASPPVAIR